MTTKLRRWYAFVKESPCVSCGESGPSEAAHVRVLLSDKTGDRLPRSHKGRAAWSCVPLCKACHLEQHQGREDEFFESRGISVAAVIATNLVKHFVEGEQHA